MQAMPTGRQALQRGSKCAGQQRVGKRQVRACAAAASGNSHQCTERGASAGSARRRFWYSASQKKGVKGAMTCSGTLVTA